MLGRSWRRAPTTLAGVLAIRSGTRHNYAEPRNGEGAPGGGPGLLLRAGTRSDSGEEPRREAFPLVSQVLWHDLKAASDERNNLALRLTTLIGGATATAFASLKLSGAQATWVSGLIFALALTTTIAAGILELMKFDERARRRRSIADALKHEGWLFFQSSAPYAGRPHRDLFPRFAERIEGILGNELASVTIRQEAPEPPASGA